MRIPTAEIVVDGRTKIVNADDPRVSRALPTRSEIAVMKKADVVEWLEAHGVSDPAGSVADLRKALASMMFVGD